VRQILKACPKNIGSMSLLDFINTCYEEITYLLLKYSNNWYERHLFLFFMAVKKYCFQLCYFCLCRKQEGFLKSVLFM
jgi:hypothetical protein